jgi:hypothetical protein
MSHPRPLPRGSISKLATPGASRILDRSEARRPQLVGCAIDTSAEVLARSTCVPGSAFQSTGEFRGDFDPEVMAGAIRAAIDAVPRRLATDPELDAQHYARALANTFDLAIRDPTSRPRPRRR